MEHRIAVFAGPASSHLGAGVCNAVKTHEVPAHGAVVELERADGYGYIQAGENRIYFHRASVLDDACDELTVGTPVAFVEERGEKGPQASTVRVPGKHHYVAPSR